MRKMADRRLRLVLALSLAAFTLVVFRAAQIQVVDASALSRKAVSQQRAVVPLPGLRGAILSADGQHLAQEQTSKTIVADKAQLRHPHHAAAVIAHALGYHQLLKRHHPKHHKKQKYRPNPVWPGRVKAIEDQLQQGGGGILRQLQPEVAARIMAQHLSGISTVTELTRWYPFHGLAPQVIGYTQVNGPGQPRWRRPGRDRAAVQQRADGKARPPGGHPRPGRAGARDRAAPAPGPGPRRHAHARHDHPGQGRVGAGARRSSRRARSGPPGSCSIPARGRSWRWPRRPATTTTRCTRSPTSRRRARRRTPRW